jgi:hypothetical protein
MDESFIFKRQHGKKKKKKKKKKEKRGGSGIFFRNLKW